MQIRLLCDSVDLTNETKTPSETFFRLVPCWPGYRTHVLGCLAPFR